MLSTHLDLHLTDIHQMAVYGANNPVKYVDESGNVVHILIGGAIGSAALVQKFVTYCNHWREQKHQS